MFARTQLAKSSLIVRTFYLTLFRMCVQTFVTRRARPVARKPPTFRHAPKVVLVKELTCVTLFAKPTQPVLAHGRKSVAPQIRSGSICGTKV